MITTSMTETPPPLYWLPQATQPSRNQFGRADGVATLLSRLADEQFNGSINALSNPHLLTLVICKGHVVGSRLQSGSDFPVLDGEAAIRGWAARTEPDAGTRSQATPLDQAVCECVTAALDPHPDVTPLASVDQLREALRHLATVEHHGVVDVAVGSSWGRVLFNHGKIIGVYQSEQPAVVASLAGIAPLAAADSATMTVRAVPRGPLVRLGSARPAIVEPDLAIFPSDAKVTIPEPLEDDLGSERDEQIESDLLWLLSDVDRDRERAARASASDAQLVQVLASFANSAYGMASQVTPIANRTLVDLDTAIISLSGQHLALGALPMKSGRIDAAALAKRCRSLPGDPGGGGQRENFFAETARALLALARFSVNHVTGQLSSRTVTLRCATALEACMISIELELPNRRFRTTD